MQWTLCDGTLTGQQNAGRSAVNALRRAVAYSQRKKGLCTVSIYTLQINRLKKPGQALESPLCMILLLFLRVCLSASSSA